MSDFYFSFKLKNEFFKSVEADDKLFTDALNDIEYLFKEHGYERLTYELYKPSFKIKNSITACYLIQEKLTKKFGNSIDYLYILEVDELTKFK
jgi:hypothetical protein